MNLGIQWHQQASEFKLTANYLLTTYSVRQPPDYFSHYSFRFH